MNQYQSLHIQKLFNQRYAADLECLLLRAHSAHLQFHATDNIYIQSAMGISLQPCCSSSQMAEDKKLSKISEEYLGNIEEYSNVSHKVPNYQNITHFCLVNKLMQYHMRFTDELYPCSILLRDSGWQRIPEVYPTSKFGAPQFQLTFQRDSQQSPYCSKTFMEAMKKMKQFPELIQRVFPNHQVSPVGFYSLYFCISGCIEHEQRREIVLDDYIPVGRKKEYNGSRISEETGIWVLLIEKALAKCLGSYQLIDYLTADQIFSQISGVPVPQEYGHNDYLISSFHEFGPEESKYIRVGISQKTNLIMAIWEECNEIDGKIYGFSNLKKMEGEQNQKFIVDIIPENCDDQIQQKVELKRINNKVIVCQQNGTKLAFPKGRYIIHIFNRGLQKIACNFVIHSNQEVTSPTEVFGATNSLNKNMMIKQMYQKVHLSRAVVYEKLGIALRIAWFGPRAVICLKNETEGKKIVGVEIIGYSIFFEDKKGQIEVEELIEAGHHQVFVLLLRSNCKYQQFGQFYRIHTRIPGEDRHQ